MEGWLVARHVSTALAPCREPWGNLGFLMHMHLVAFEPILVSALFLAQLAVPSQLLQALGLDAVADLHGIDRGPEECQEQLSLQSLLPP